MSCLSSRLRVAFRFKTTVSIAVAAFLWIGNASCRAFRSSLFPHCHRLFHNGLTPTSVGTTTTFGHRNIFLESPRGGACSPKMTDNGSNTAQADDDPYIWLEDVESAESLAFAKACNEACLASLGDPTTSATRTYERVLSVLESKNRIPHVSHYGLDDTSGQPLLYNFWQDASHPKGVWRQTTLESYQQDEPHWNTVLDVDELAAQDGVSWVYKGNTPLPRARDESSPTRVTRALISLSRGGSDAVHIREFDLLTQQFVGTSSSSDPEEEQADPGPPFVVPEAKTRVSYKSRNVLLIGTEVGGKDSLTDSGYPRQVREWVRGTRLDEAPVVFEGEKTDVSVGLYVADERIWGGGLYEVRYRSLTFYTSIYWCRKISRQHLLAPNDPEREGVPEAPDFVKIDIPDDASISFLGQMSIISLRSDWQPSPDGRTFPSGAILWTLTDPFLEKSAAASEFTPLFVPTERTAYEYHTVTKNYLILSTLDTVQSKLEFFRIAENGSQLNPIETTATKPQIRDCSCRPVDPYTGSDEFFFTTSDYVTPSTLCLADASKVVDAEADTENDATADPDSFITQKLKSLPPQYDSSNLVVEQRMAKSRDGTQIPYFIVMPRELVLDGSNPTLLYGYGGFEVSLGPHYIATSGLAWLERGNNCVYVEANIRGGGEFGPSWHQAALKEKRHKAYEDFIAVAEDLIHHKICTPQTLAARGGSNGGLLMGNMYIMRPDLFGALHCAVPLLDMQRYHTLLAGASWMAEYGNPDTDDWTFLKQYSPYHNIDPDANYPPILVTTSTRDDRVHPGHARKFVKKLQDVGMGQWPVYYYENIEGGHGGAADAKQSAFMTALAYDFMFDTLSKNRSESYN